MNNCNAETEQAGTGEVQFVVDTLKLSHNYKIEKFDFFHQDWEIGGLMDEEEANMKKRSEAEERVRWPIPLTYVREIWIRKAKSNKDETISNEIFTIVRRKYPWIVVKKVNI